MIDAHGNTSDISGCGTGGTAACRLCQFVFADRMTGPINPLGAPARAGPARSGADKSKTKKPGTGTCARGQVRICARSSPSDVRYRYHAAHNTGRRADCNR
ncbi:hypothetical protein CFR79_03565 [Komagataeibacter saccharivorans]|nr:hypothetical protein CFR79_03565 [Komagataeibacter saccharivorans]